MIIDTSVLVAILKQEPGWKIFARILDSSPGSFISASTYVELSIVVDRWKNPTLSSRVDELIEQFHIVIEPVTPEQARIARQAYRDYGKGSGHLARLNFGDCFSYALARVRREPILFKGDDFLHTDLRSAVPEP
ncbi:MAG TPA: type II toxin-antitoxin system VapC family toxin [Terracidiphilus sp.]|jgi:ribonuclease VapC|nr:type II toxin-antitoxin system VapC family toxin [Terracidiphilus sp.]